MARLEVFLVTPEREVWSGEATMVIARGTEGEIGILAGHAPVLVRLRAEGTVRIQHAGGEERAEVGGGFMHVTSEGDSTRVDVLAQSVSVGGGEAG